MCLSLIVNWYLKINNKCKSVRYTWLKKRFKFLLYSRGFDCIHNHPGSQQVRSKNRTSPGGPRLFCLVWGYSLSIIQRNRQDRNHIACTVCVRHTVNRSENYPKSRIISASNIQRFNINKEIADFIMQRINMRWNSTTYDIGSIREILSKSYRPIGDERLNPFDMQKLYKRIKVITNYLPDRWSTRQWWRPATLWREFLRRRR